MSEILKVEGLKLYYRTSMGIVKAVDDVSLNLKERETLALIGESGCGKTSLARALIRFLPRNIAEFSGNIWVDGINVMRLSDAEFDKYIRWKKISYVSQAAINSLNPVIKVVDHLVEVLALHLGIPKKEATNYAREIIEKVGIPKDFLFRYPFELSGGMRQRVVIALSLITSPKIVILDEPTSALDVMTQANIMNLLKEIKQSTGISYIFITHDIATSSELADKVAVMYAGQVVEFGSAEQIYTNPFHPYSRALLDSVPKIHVDKSITYIPGTPPSLISPPPGCRFRPRCPLATDICIQDPPVVKIDSEGYVRCWLYAGR